MTSTDHEQVAWQRRFHNPMRRQGSVSPDNAAYALGLLFLSGMRVIPASRRIPVINTASPLLARLLCAANTASARMIRENLNTVFGSIRPRESVPADVHRLLSMTVWNSLVISSLPVLPRSQVVELAQIEGISCLDVHLTGGHPVLIWNYHFGIDPLIVAAVLHARGYPVHTISHVRQMPATASAFQRLYLLQLHSVGEQLSVIDPQEGIQHKMLDVLRNKECLYITPDYMLPRSEIKSQSASVVPIDFLGRRAYLQAGGLRLAKRHRAKIVTVLSAQDDKNPRRLMVEPLELPTPGFTPAELQQDLQIGMRRLEAQVLARPYLWLDLKRNDLAERLETTANQDR